MDPDALAAVPAGECRLYFALYPDPGTAVAIAAMADSVRTRLGLSGRPVPVDRLHVTLNYLGSFEGLRPDVVAAAGVAADRLVAGAVTVEFDTVASFDSRRRAYPLVLRGGGNAALRLLQDALTRSLLETRVIAAATPYEPHLTLLYDRMLVAAEAVAPVRWTSNELVLVCKRTGREHDEMLRRWPLGSAVPGDVVPEDESAPSSADAP